MIDTKTTTVESLLGVLSLGPMSGYAMRQFMEKSTANFWSESFGQIYPALKAMLAEGLVEADGPGSEGRPGTKVYRITEAGEQRLRDWLGVPARPQVHRNELLLKVFFGDRAEPGAIAGHVHARRARCAADLERYEGILLQLQRDCAHDAGLPYWCMTLRYGIAEAKALMNWCDETLVELEKQGIGNRE